MAHIDAKKVYTHRAPETLTLAASEPIGEEKEGWPEEKSIVVTAASEPPPTAMR